MRLLSCLSREESLKKRIQAPSHRKTTQKKLLSQILTFRKLRKYTNLCIFDYLTDKFQLLSSIARKVRL